MSNNGPWEIGLPRRTRYTNEDMNTRLARWITIDLGLRWHTITRDYTREHGTGAWNGAIYHMGRRDSEYHNTSTKFILGKAHQYETAWNQFTFTASMTK